MRLLGSLPSGSYHYIVQQEWKQTHRKTADHRVSAWYMLGLQATSAVPAQSLVAVLHHQWSLSTLGGWIKHWIWSFTMEKMAQRMLRTAGPSHEGLTEGLCVKVCIGQLLNWESQSDWAYRACRRGPCCTCSSLWCWKLGGYSEHPRTLLEAEEDFQKRFLESFASSAKSESIYSRPEVTNSAHDRD